MASPAHIRLPSLEGLQAFEVCARHGSFERAATELDVTTSAISKRISAVEELVGAVLFYRTGGKLILTPIGSEYLDDVKVSLAQLAKITLHQRRMQRAERLRIVAPPTFARQVLVPRLSQFTRLHPDAEIEIVVSIPYLTLEAPPADVQISFDVAREPSARLLFEPVFPMCTPTYLRGLGELRIPTDLGRGLLLRCPLEPWQPWFVAAGISLPEPSRGPKLVDIGMTLEAAAAGMGIALGRRSLAAPWIKRGELVRAYPIQAHTMRGYCMQLSNPTRVATGFATWLQDICADIEKDSAKL